MTTQSIAFIAFFAPFVGCIMALICPLFRRFSQRQHIFAASLIACVCMGLCTLCTLWTWLSIVPSNDILHIHVWQWIQSDYLNISFGIMCDKTSTTMMLMVVSVSFIVHVYSVGYMEKDPGRLRFMAYLSFFTFCMLILIMAPNLMQLFMGWEGVGLASYLLIGFWYHKPSANNASIKAFVVNRVGDAGLVIGLAGLFFLVSSLDVQNINHAATTQPELFMRASFSCFGHEINAALFISLALFIGVMGKSAQIGLHTWLPDAMEGPTPVSALIHAATMVTAGVYLLIRLQPVFALSAEAQNVIAIIGGVTCFFAATLALVQTDIKRIIAFSTCSQLGYMVMSAGVGATDAAFFHLITHGAFKALLFLGAGSVIHAMSDEQNIEHMGGIWKSVPLTYAMMWIGSLALAGLPFFSGFFSKDAILISVLTHEGHIHETGRILLFGTGVVTAGMTAFYSWRLLIKVFHGKPRANDRVMAHVHESPFLMTLPLIALAVPSILLGGMTHGFFLNGHHDVPLWIEKLPVVASITGLALAYFVYGRGAQISDAIQKACLPVDAFLRNGWFFDKIYTKVFVKGALKLGHVLWQGGDMHTINPLGPDGLSRITMGTSRILQRLQTGYVYHYACIMLAGLVCMMGYVLFLENPIMVRIGEMLS